MDFKNIIADLVHKELGIPKHDIIPLIEIPPEQELGDYALPCFSFAKSLKKSPQNIALELKEKLTLINLKEDHKHFELITNVGPYINFFVNKKAFIKNTLHTILKEKDTYGKPKDIKKQTILIESPGPNTNKPLHLGHLRNILLGQGIHALLTFQGHDARIVNVVNDRGVHICKSMLAYQKFGHNTTPEKEGKKSDHFVGDYYVKYAEYEKEHPDAEKEIQEMLIKWEDNDLEIRALWKKMNDWALQGFRETYIKLDFHIEKEYYESDTYLAGKQIILDALKNGIFERDENGSIIANLDDKQLGKKVLVRANGTAVYITQDIYMAKKRYDDYAFDQMIYVVGNEQEFHFKVLFEIFKKLGWKFADACVHYSYGMVELPEGKMKSREGTVIDTDDLIDEVTKIAREELLDRYKTISDEELDKRSRIIAMSALRFFFIKHDPARNFVFNPKESLSFDGETGPYVEYGYARINSIFKKAEINPEIAMHGAEVSYLKEQNEFELVKILDRYPVMIAESAAHLKPSMIAHYLLELTQKFNEFYHANPILTSEEAVKKARLYLIYCIQIVLKSGMTLLHIDTIDEM
jgi:arginyl-tRNA synthetase